MTPAIVALVVTAQRGATLAARLSAVQRLEARPSMSAEPFLAALALDRSQPGVLRAEAAHALAVSRSAGAPRYLVPLLEDDDAGVRGAALGSLAALGGADEELLQRAAMTDDSPDVRLAAARALAGLRTTLSQEALPVVGLDVDPAVRAAVARELEPR